MLTVKDVAKKLGISVSAVRIRVGKGKLPAPDKRVGNEFYWREETLTIIEETSATVNNRQVVGRSHRGNNTEVVEVYNYGEQPRDTEKHPQVL